MSTILDGWQLLAFNVREGFAIWVFFKNDKAQEETITMWGLKFQPIDRYCLKTKWEIVESQI